MFQGCSSLSSLDLSNFDTSKVTSLLGLFANCNSLTHIDIRNFRTQSLSDKSTYIFPGRTPNGTIVYNSKLFDEEIINIVFEDWEKEDISSFSNLLS